jgi:hypothetical protein
MKKKNFGKVVTTFGNLVQTIFEFREREERRMKRNRILLNTKENAIKLVQYNVTSDLLCCKNCVLFYIAPKP